MSSAEVVGSGGRSNFSQMCTLLSQYLKENGGFGDLKLGLNHKAETMDLFPIAEKSGQGSRNPNVPPPFAPNLAAHKKSYLSDPETAQMTIFYGGKVMVFDDFPSDKFNDITDLATKSSSAQNRPHATLKSDSANFGLHLSAQLPLDSDLPIARKNSLARFLEKRKDRIAANAPYPSTATKPRGSRFH